MYAVTMKGVCGVGHYEEVDFAVLITCDKVSLSNLGKCGDSQSSPLGEIIWGIEEGNGVGRLDSLACDRNTWSVSFLDSLSATTLFFPGRYLATLLMSK